MCLHTAPVRLSTAEQDVHVRRTKAASKLGHLGISCLGACRALAIVGGAVRACTGAGQCMFRNCVERGPSGRPTEVERSGDHRWPSPPPPYGVVHRSARYRGWPVLSTGPLNKHRRSVFRCSPAMRRRPTCGISPAWLTPVSSPARVGCGIPSTSRTATRHPGAELLKLTAGRAQGCPWGAAWLGSAGSMECRRLQRARPSLWKEGPLLTMVLDCSSRNGSRTLWAAVGQAGRSGTRRQSAMARRDAPEPNKTYGTGAIRLITQRS
jgi:hypothetical protein